MLGVWAGTTIRTRWLVDSGWQCSVKNAGHIQGSLEQWC